MSSPLDIMSGSSYFVDPDDSVFDMSFNIIATAYVRANINEHLERESLLSLYRRWYWRGEVEELFGK